MSEMSKYSLCLLLGVMMLILLPMSELRAQNAVLATGGSVVGGVEIDANGILKTATKESMADVGKSLARLMEPIPDDLSKEAPIRKISLKKLDDAMRQVIAKQGEFSDAVRYLGGLTSIQYLVLLPEENDILLVGPSEPWIVDAQGNVVGKVSGRPILRLEDMLTVYRAWNHQDRPSVITCSIDPTREALVKIAQIDKRFPPTPQNVRAFAEAQEDAYGMNVVTVTGVPNRSRFAKILVACDYKMKRIGLGQESSMVRGLPSYTSLIGGSQKQISPRFWLAPEYGTVTHDSRKLTWKLSTVKVKAMTEDEIVDVRSGSRAASGKTDPAAINWCNKMTTHYETLGKVEPVFAELRNCMELAIVVALVHRERLLEKAHCKLPAFDDESVLKMLHYPVPKSVPSKSTIVNNGRTLLVACGGVDVNPFEAIAKADLDSKIDAEREKLSAPTGDSWYSSVAVPAKGRK